MGEMYMRCTSDVHTEYLSLNNAFLMFLIKYEKIYRQFNCSITVQVKVSVQKEKTVYPVQRVYNACFICTFITYHYSLICLLTTYY